MCYIITTNLKTNMYCIDSAVVANCINCGAAQHTGIRPFSTLKMYKLNRSNIISPFYIFESYCTHEIATVQDKERLLACIAIW